MRHRFARRCGPSRSSWPPRFPVLSGWRSLADTSWRAVCWVPSGLWPGPGRRTPGESLGARLPVANPGDEFGRLATVFNETLARLDAAFEQLRRFTADASHELRTPLTAIRSVGEVALERSLSADGYREVVGSMLEEVDRLTRLVENLLLLTRGETGRIPVAAEAVSLRRLARALAEPGP